MSLTDAEERDLLKNALRPFGKMMLNVFTDASDDTPVTVSFTYKWDNPEHGKGEIPFSFTLMYKDLLVARDPMNPNSPAR